MGYKADISALLVAEVCALAYVCSVCMSRCVCVSRSCGSVPANIKKGRATGEGNFVRELDRPP